MKNVTLLDRLRYKFDNLMSRGTVALILALFFLSALVILVVSLLAYFTPDGRVLGLPRLVWWSLMRTLDPGTMGGDEGSPLFLFWMFAVTIGGIFIVSTLIGVLSSGIEDRLDQLRKGRSQVLEQDHTVILGWSPQVFSIINELVIANANQPHGAIAVLAEKSKVEMEDEIRSRCGPPGKTRIVCRTGNPMDLNDLEIVNPRYSRSIIVLSSAGDNPDAQVIKTILALTNNPQRRPEPYHIVASIHDPANLEAAQLVGRGEARLLLADELISRIIAQTCRQSGLSVVYTELLDFGGDEIYFGSLDGLLGKTFGEALLAFRDSSLIGLRFADGRIALNPPGDTVIQHGDLAVAISEDDDTIRISPLADARVDTRAIRTHVVQPMSPERTLFLGWNSRAAFIVQELDHYVEPGSEVTIVTALPEAEILPHLAGLHNQRVTCVQAEITQRKVLDGLAPQDYDHIVLLSYSGLYDVQEADARTLIVLLHLREIAARLGRRFSIVSEMLDLRNRDLAEVTNVDDFIVSDRLISLMLSQVSENARLGEVFQDLFDPQGSEIYLKPVDQYVETGRPVNFYTVVEAARRRGEVAFGYRLFEYAEDPGRHYGVIINPEKDAFVEFSPADRIIVLAEDD